jgi:hypothetical protein
MGLLDKIKDNLQETANMAKEGLGDLQTKRELASAYGELGRKAFDLIDQGKLTATDLNVDVDKIRKLKAELEAEEKAEAASEQETAGTTS